jgi:hypothetical protein
MVIENAAQNIQLGIIGGKGVTTILEYNIEISRQIDWERGELPIILVYKR